MQVFCQLSPSGQDIDCAPALTRIAHLEAALQKAISNISVLQDNLSYVIRLKEELQTEVRLRNQREQLLQQELASQIARKERELGELRNREQEILGLLQDTKNSLEQSESGRQQREDENRRMQRIIQDQKSTLQALEDELLAAKYGADLSYQNLTQDNSRTQELERDNEHLRFELQRTKAQLEREAGKARKTQKDLEQFKAWLAGAVGLKRVVEGCENMLMEQISARLALPLN